MEFRRETCRAVAGMTLFLWTAAASSGPREPLTIIRLADPETRLESIATAAAADDGTDIAIAEFSRSIAEDLRAEQQSIAARCRSIPGASAATGVRWAWAAHCRYQRR